MKRLFHLVSAAVFFLALGFRLSASEAIPFYGYTSSTGVVYSPNIVGYAVGGGGFAFSPSTDISVYSLGYNGVDLASEGYQVTLWNASGTPLATAVVTTGNPLVNQTRYQPVAPLTLNAGSTYYLQAVGLVSGMWLGEAIVGSGPDANGTFSVAPEISYLGYAVGLNSSSAFPNLVYPGADAYLIGPNFQFVVPEPSVFCLGGLSLAALAMARRFRVV